LPEENALLPESATNSSSSGESDVDICFKEKYIYKSMDQSEHIKANK